jgi:hypothetical protein
MHLSSSYRLHEYMIHCYLHADLLTHLKEKLKEHSISFQTIVRQMQT